MDELWRCVYNNADQLYFAKVFNDEVMISDGFNIVRRYSTPNINGCAYNGDTLWLSMKENNSLLAVDSADNVTYIKILAEGAVRIFKAASGQKNYLVLDIPYEEKSCYVLFDCFQKAIVTRLPITINCKPGCDTLDDLYVEADNNTGHIICEYKEEVPSRYSDEINDEDILFYAELFWNEHDSIASITKRIHLYIDYETSDNVSGNQTLLSDSDLRFPLFCYLRHWLIQKSFSSSGRYVVYYCPDICGLIIGEPIGGRVYKIIDLPYEVAEENNQFFFNDLRNQLYVIDQDNMIRIYSIECSDLEAVEILNQVYDAYVKRISHQRRCDAGDLSFWKILKRAIASFSCKLVLKRNRSALDCNKNGFSVTIETPVSEVLVSECAHEKVVSFEESLPKTVENNPDFSSNMSMELREIRSMLETLIEEKTDKKYGESSVKDNLKECVTISEKTEGRVDVFFEDNIEGIDLKEKFPEITLKNFIYMFTSYSRFEMTEEKILNVIGRTERTFRRYVDENDYGMLDKQHYEPLFDLYEQTYENEKKRVEILVRFFSMPNQCMNWHYNDIKNIIIDTLHARCMSTSVIKKRNKN